MDTPRSKRPGPRRRRQSAEDADAVPLGDVVRQWRRSVDRQFLDHRVHDGPGGDLSLTFDVLGELRAFSDEVGGVAVVDFDFGLSLFDITNAGQIDIGISSLDGEPDFCSLNQARSALRIEEFNYLVDDTFTITATGLFSDTSYRL